MGETPHRLERTDRTHRDHQPPALDELAQERLGEVVGSGGDNNGVIGSVLVPPEVAVGFQHVDLQISESLQKGPRRGRQLRDDLHRVDLDSHLGENRCLISRPGTDLEHLVPRLDLEQLGHPGHDVGLRDGLTVSDGQRVIFVGLVEIIGGHELMAGNSPHRLQDQWVAHITGLDLEVDHGISLLCIGLRIGDRVTDVLLEYRVAGIVFGPRRR